MPLRLADGQQSRPTPARFHAITSTVPADYRATMVGVSWKPGCPVPIDDLRIITMNHWGFDGAVHEGGRLMVHKDVAKAVTKAFGKAFDARFPIRRIELIEAYGADDDASMAADNTSAFNCRPITGTHRPVLDPQLRQGRSTSTPSRTRT